MATQTKPAYAGWVCGVVTHFLCGWPLNHINVKPAQAGFFLCSNGFQPVAIWVRSPLVTEVDCHRRCAYRGRSVKTYGYTDKTRQEMNLVKSEFVAFHDWTR